MVESPGVFIATGLSEETERDEKKHLTPEAPGSTFLSVPLVSLPGTSRTLRTPSKRNPPGNHFDGVSRVSG